MAFFHEPPPPPPPGRLERMLREDQWVTINLAPEERRLQLYRGFMRDNDNAITQEAFDVALAAHNAAIANNAPAPEVPPPATPMDIDDPMSDDEENKPAP